MTSSSPASLRDRIPHPAWVARAMWRDAAVLVVLAAISIAHIGYVYGYSDMAAWIPLIRHRMAPAVFRNDWFVMLNEGFNAPFVWMMTEAGRLVGLEAAFFLLHVLERLLLVFAMYTMSRRLNPSRLAATLAAGLALFAYDWHLGGNTFVAPMTIPHTLAIVPGVFALGFVLGGRPIAAAVTAAVTTYIHVLLGVEVALLVLGCTLAFERRRPRCAWTALGSYALLAAPVLIPIALSQLRSTGAAALSGREYIGIVGGIRAPWHYLPSTWPLSQYLIFLTYGLAAALAAVLVRDRLRADAQRRASFLLGAILFLCVVGTVFVEWLPSSTVLKLQFFRLMVFVRVFGSVYLASYIATWPDQRTPVATLVSALVIASAVHPYAFAVSITLAIGWRMGRERPLPAWPRAIALLFACLVGTTLLLLGSAIVPPGSPVAPGPLRITVLQLEWGAIVAGALVTWWTVQLARHGQYNRALALGVSALAAGHLGARLLPRPVTWQRLQAAARGRIQVRLQATGDWGRLCEWIRHHTSVDAVFLTPPYVEGFRLRAERAAVLEFKAFAYQEPDTREWRDRFLDITSHVSLTSGANVVDDMRRGYAALTTTAAQAIAVKYGAQFVVRERSQDLALPVVYEAESYVLYCVDATTCR